MTLVEGPELLRDVVASGAKVVEIFDTSPSGPDVTAVDERALTRLAGTKNPRGPVAVVEIPIEWLDRTKNLLVSVGVSDPGNVGTMVRTAAAFGWGFAYLEDTADPWAPKTIRAGGGGQFQTSIARIGSIAELAEWTSVATTVQGGSSPDDVEGGPIALLIGAESGGLPDNVLEHADYAVTIETPGATESLNAAVAAGILIHAFSGKPAAGV